MSLIDLMRDHGEKTVLIRTKCDKNEGTETEVKPFG